MSLREVKQLFQGHNDEVENVKFINKRIFSFIFLAHTDSASNYIFKMAPEFGSFFFSLQFLRILARVYQSEGRTAHLSPQQPPLSLFSYYLVIFSADPGSA